MVLSFCSTTPGSCISHIHGSCAPCEVVGSDAHSWCKCNIFSLRPSCLCVVLLVKMEELLKTKNGAYTVSFLCICMDSIHLKRPYFFLSHALRPDKTCPWFYIGGHAASNGDFHFASTSLTSLLPHDSMSIQTLGPIWVPQMRLWSWSNSSFTHTHTCARVV